MKKLLVLAAAMQMSVLVAGEVDIKGLDKGVLVRALYEHACWTSYHSAPLSDDQVKMAYTPAPLSDAQVKTALEEKGMMFYLNNRTMMIIISGDTLNTRAYNHLYGQDAAEVVIERLRNQKQ